MSFIPGAFKQGATHLTGAIKKGAKWTQMGAKAVSSLSYMNVDDDNNDGDEGGEGEDKDALPALSVLIRLLLCPVVVPLGMVYVTFFARGQPVAIELDTYDSETDDEYEPSESGSSDEATTPVKPRTWASACRRFISVHILRMEESNVVLDGMDPKQLSYELFLVKQKAKQLARKGMTPYVVATTVARTDRVKFPYDGVYVGNTYVAVDDVPALERELAALEARILEEAAAAAEGIETDEWESGGPGVARGDSRVLLKQLLKQAQQGQALLTKGASPYPARPRYAVDEGLAPSASESKEASVAMGADGMNTPVKKQKPRKAPVDPSTPLAERLNMQKVDGVTAEGPSLSHTSGVISSHFNG